MRHETPAQGPGGTVKVLIVDDHRMFGQSLHRILDDETDVDVVGTASTIAEGLEAMRETAPDIVLMDYELPDGDGATATEMVKAERPEIEVVILTGRRDDATVSAALDAGCADYVTKDEPIEKVVSTVRAVASGNRLLSRARLRALLPSRSGSGGPAHDLTNRELQVLRLLAQGLSSRDIAERLVISVNTARHHIQRTIAKMGAHSKLEAVSIAVRDGIIRYP